MLKKGLVIDMWHEGTVGIPVEGGKTKIAHWYVKSFKECSEYGINGGKISKLSIKIDGVWVADYDRDWLIEPAEDDKLAQVTLAILLNAYN